MARGKGKRGGRGSGRRFAAQSAEEIEERNRRLAAFDEQRAKHRAEAAEENGMGGGKDDDNAEAEREAMLVGMRVARMNMEGSDDDGYVKKERKAKGLEGIIETENPNKTRGSGMLKIKDLGSGPTPPEQMTRKQREEAERAAKAAAYRRRHEMGLTEEYKRDMAKLNEVRKRREAAEARKKAESEMEKSMEEERKKDAMKAGAVDDGKEEKKSKKKKSKDNDIPKLEKIAIKKMKPTQLKEALKARGLDIQGNAKALTERLLQYEKNR